MPELLTALLTLATLFVAIVVVLRYDEVHYAPLTPADSPPFEHLLLNLLGLILLLLLAANVFYVAIRIIALAVR